MRCIVRCLIFVLLAALLLTATACSATKDYSPGTGDSEAPGDNSEVPGDNGDFPRQVIYNVWLSLRVENLDGSVAELAKNVRERGGYIAGSVQDSTGDEPWARITYRIPQAQYEEFLAYARSLGKAGQETISSTDVTEEFVDLQARLANRKRHEESLAAMFAQAKTVEELIQVERELSRVREDIEVIEGRLRYLNDMVAMATIEITFRQAPGATEIPGLRPLGVRETLRRSGRAIVTSTTLFLDFLSFLIVALAAFLPFALPVALGVYLIVRARKKRKMSA